MKKTLTLILFLLTQVAFAQNLVPNWSFEDTVACPLSANQVDRAVYWSSFRNSPEYFNYCSNQQAGIVGVPNNFIGYQYPHSGDAYAGLIPFDLTGAPYREYIGIQLVNPTIQGQKYYVTFYVNWAGTIGFTIAINKLGIALTKVLYSQTNPYPITNNPKAYTDSTYHDSTSWNKIQLQFVADSAYNYLIIGNFFDDVNTDTLNLGQFNVHSYYYIDDVCLSTDSNYCSNFTTVNELNIKPINSLIKKYFIDGKRIKIYFYDSSFLKNIFIYSPTGQILKNIKSNQSEVEFYLSEINSFYLLNVSENNKTQSIKIQTIQN